MTEPTSQVRKNQILGVDAAEVEVADAGGYYAGANGETVLQEVGADNAASIHDNVSGEIDALTALTLPVMGDVLLAESSAASFAKRELSLASLALLKNDMPLLDSTNGNHFMEYAAGAPTGWTAVVAGATCATNRLYSSWTLGASTTARTLKYRKQSGITIESLPANQGRTFEWGPLLMRDGQYPRDILYTFGVYLDNAGTIDETKYNKVFLKWDYATLTWLTWCEVSNGSTTVTGSGYALSYPLPILYLRQTIYNNAAKTLRGYFGTNYEIYSHTLLLDTSSATATWGNVWLQVEVSRSVGGGATDLIHIGAIDTFGE